MNTIEKADKYADGKANEAITKLLPRPISMVIGMATMTEKLKYPQILGTTKLFTLIQVYRVELFGRQIMRKMEKNFSTFLMRELNI